MRRLRSYLDEVVLLCRAHTAASRDGKGKAGTLSELERVISDASSRPSSRWVAMRLSFLMSLVSRLPRDNGVSSADQCSLENIGRSIMLSNKYYEHTEGVLGIADHRLIRACRCLLKCLDSIISLVLDKDLPFPAAFSASVVMGSTLDRLLQDFNRLIWYKHSVSGALHTARLRALPVAQRRLACGNSSRSPCLCPSCKRAPLVEREPVARKGAVLGSEPCCCCCFGADPLFQAWLRSTSLQQQRVGSQG